MGKIIQFPEEKLSNSWFCRTCGWLLKDNEVGWCSLCWDELENDK